MMKKFLLAAAAFCFAGLAIADGHGNKIYFEQRHEGTPMEVTSVHLNADGGTITAEGQMGTYGRTYVTYKLTARPDGKSGWVDVEGRGLWPMAPSPLVLALESIHVMAPLSRFTS